MKKYLSLIIIVFLTISGFTQEKKPTDIKDKYYEYASQKKDAWGAFILNSIFGFGIGSFVQGDNTGGAVGMIMDLAGVGLIVGGIFTFDLENPQISNARNIGGTTMVLIGVASLFTSKIFQLIIPFIFTEQYNAQLRKNLNTAFRDFIPSFDININPNSTVGFNLAFTKTL